PMSAASWPTFSTPWSCVGTWSHRRATLKCRCCWKTSRCLERASLSPQFHKHPRLIEPRRGHPLAARGALLLDGVGNGPVVHDRRREGVSGGAADQGWKRLVIAKVGQIPAAQGVQ